MITVSSSFWGVQMSSSSIFTNRELLTPGIHFGPVEIEFPCGVDGAHFILVAQRVCSISYRAPSHPSSAPYVSIAFQLIISLLSYLPGSQPLGMFVNLLCHSLGIGIFAAKLICYVFQLPPPFAPKQRLNGVSHYVALCGMMLLKPLFQALRRLSTY